jgi:hypothetical protein
MPVSATYIGGFTLTATTPFSDVGAFADLKSMTAFLSEVSGKKPLYVVAAIDSADRRWNSKKLISESENHYLKEFNWFQERNRTKIEIHQEVDRKYVFDVLLPRAGVNLSRLAGFPHGGPIRL